MNKSVTINIPTSTRNKTLGKILFIVLISGGFGYYFTIYAAAKYQAGKQLNLREYTANYEQYKAKLLSPGPIPVPVGMFLMLIIMAMIFGLYELLSLLLGLMIGKLITPKPNDGNE